MMLHSKLPTRILMTADTLGGVWTYAMSLCRALKPYGVEIVLATMGGAMSPAQAREASSLNNLRVREGLFKLEWMENPWQEVQEAGHWLMELQAAYSPDIIHLNNYVHASLNWQAPVLVTAHSCVLSWWQAVHNEAAPPQWKTYYQKVRRGMQAADLVIAVSYDMLQAVQRYYGPIRNITMIPNGRDHSCFFTVPKEPFIFTMGRVWDEAKNIYSLCEIARELDWPVHVAGWNKHPDHQQSLKLNNVCFHGPLQAGKVRELLSRAAIYALPARYEPFGLSVLEAALSSCALMLGDIESLRENWFQSALFAKPNDPEDILRQLRQLSGKRQLRNMLAERAYQQAINFSLENLGQRYAQAYNHLITVHSLKNLIP